MSLSKINVNNTQVVAVDNEPIINSENLIKSGSVFDLKIDVEENSEKIINIDTLLFEGDIKNFDEILNYVDNNDAVWFQYPKIRISYINKIRYKANIGTVNFYKITYNESETTIENCTLITSVNNSTYGEIKEIDVDITLDENQFVGINGSFYFNSDSDEGVSRWFDVATGTVREKSLQVLAYEILNSDSLISSVNSLENKITEKDASIDKNSKSISAINSELYEGDRKDIDLIAIPAEFTDHFWVQWPKIKINHIDKIRYRARIGITNFYKVTYNDTTKTATKQLITSVQSYSEGVVNEIDVDITLDENQFVGINGCFWFANDTASQGFLSNYFNSSTGAINSETPDKQVLAYELLNTSSVDSRLEKIEENFEDKNLGKFATLLNEKLTSNKDFISGTQNFGTFGLIVSDKILITKMYSLSRRSATFLCKFASNTVAAVETIVSVSDGSGNTYFTINIPEKSCQCNGLQIKYCDILISGHIIAISIEKDYGLQILTITNITLGKRQIFSWRFNGTGGVGAGAVGTLVNTGMQYDYYRLRKVSGTQFEVSQVTIVAPKADVVIYGDSITEGEAYWPAKTLYQHWVQLIVDKMKGRAVGSGRSGFGINQMFDWMQNEIPFIKPKYVMITIGTNGGVTQSKLEQIVDYIRNIGSEPIINHIPANINLGGVSNHVAVNQIIDAVRISKDVVGADFDIVTSIGGVPSNGVNTDMMWEEDYGGQTGTVYHHPNELGSMAMYQKLLLDVP